jgi:hypothetical protein
MAEFKFPTEQVELPSKGLIYPEDSPLRSGVVEMKYMTAKEEDILTNQNYIKDGTVIEKLLRSLIISKVDYDDMIVGDRNAIMVAARVLGYGKDYTFNYKDEEITVDLSILEPRYLNEANLEEVGINKFTFKLPTTGNVIDYKLLNGKDDKTIRQEIKGIQKLNKQASPELSTRLKHMILAVDGNEDKKTIREFVDNHMLARDSKAFRDYLKATQPDVDLTFTFEGSNGVEEDVEIPIGVTFFWPDSNL